MKVTAAALFAGSIATVTSSDAANGRTLFRGRGPPQTQSGIPVIDLSATGEELRIPEQISSPGKSVMATLRYDVLEYQGPAYNANVRAYNGQLPGPTIRIKPGDRLKINLVNDLNDPVGNLMNNEYQHPNQTNIHTHGPHISGEDPGDNIFLKVEESVFPGYAEAEGKNVGPKEFHRYRYDIDENHMPGTMWYHPHLHGSTAIQTSTSSGMLIIEDPDDYPLHDIIKDMPEVQMMIYNIEIGTGDNFGDSGSGGLKRQAMVAGDRVSNWTEGVGFHVTDSTFDPYGRSGTFEENVDVFLPNFQFQPKKTMKENTWYRYRMCMATAEQNLVLGFEHGNCEMKLLAKDGVYVKVNPTSANQYGPRPIDAIFLSSGSRADVAIRCSDDDNMIQLASGGSDFDPDLYPSPSQITIFSIETESGSGSDPDLPTYYNDIPTPCYQADLRGATVLDAQKSTVVYNGVNEPMSVYSGPFNPAVFPMFGAAVPYSDEFTPIETFELGQVRELNLFTAGVHPHHQHVNHYQLYDVESITDYGIMSDETKTWYKSGDWHDLFQWPRGFTGAPPVPPPLRLITALVRFPLNQFAGRMTFHCHRLNHEDIGMIAFWQINGEEGTLVDTSVLDPTCVSPVIRGNSGQ